MMDGGPPFLRPAAGQGEDVLGDAEAMGPTHIG